jgi:hypothetical protein
VSDDFSAELAKALQERLNAVTPWHVRVKVFVPPGRGYGYKIRSWKWLSGQGGEGSAVGWEDATLDVLRGVQHFLSDGMKRSWPSDEALPSEPDWSSGPPSGEEVRRRAKAYLGVLPRPGAEATGSEIRLWYGSRDRPVLELVPVATADVD